MSKKKVFDIEYFGNGNNTEENKDWDYCVNSDCKTIFNEKDYEKKVRIDIGDKKGFKSYLLNVLGYPFSDKKVPADLNEFNVVDEHLLTIDNLDEGNRKLPLLINIIKNNYYDIFFQNNNSDKKIDDIKFYHKNIIKTIGKKIKNNNISKKKYKENVNITVNDNRLILDRKLDDNENKVINYNKGISFRNVHQHTDNNYYDIKEGWKVYVYSVFGFHCYKEIDALIEFLKDLGKDVYNNEEKKDKFVYNFQVHDDKKKAFYMNKLKLLLDKLFDNMYTEEEIKLDDTKGFQKSNTKIHGDKFVKRIQVKYDDLELFDKNYNTKNNVYEDIKNALNENIKNIGVKNNINLLKYYNTFTWFNEILSQCIMNYYFPKNVPKVYRVIREGNYVYMVMEHIEIKGEILPKCIIDSDEKNKIVEILKKFFDMTDFNQNDKLKNYKGIFKESFKLFNFNGFIQYDTNLENFINVQGKYKFIDFQQTYLTDYFKDDYLHLFPLHLYFIFFNEENNKKNKKKSFLNAFFDTFFYVKN